VLELEQADSDDGGGGGGSSTGKYIHLTITKGSSFLTLTSFRTFEF
jgi:hypothetical protein